MTTKYRIPHVTAVEVTGPHVMQVTFDDGVVRELEFVVGGNEGTVFAPFEDPEFFAQVCVDPMSRTVVWPNGVDIDPAVLHGDFEPAGVSHFREIHRGRSRRRA